ncbi:MAG: hypothetical protein HY868_01480 [Chloroflexi bacterium]|nr:hypothetical protein [Chloroflexota bacterium]
MKYLKVLVPVLVVVAMLLVVLPAGAQGPTIQTTDGSKAKAIFVRTAGTNEDPFGGLPIQTSTGFGSATKYGVGGPGIFLRNGGVPSVNSGDGTSPRKSVYVGGAWAAGSYPENEGPQELPTCATVKLPAGSSRWFKLDAWKNKKQQIWVDDELNTATAPSGKSVFGAGDNYMWGLNWESRWAANSFFDAPWALGTKGHMADGFVMAVYDQDAMFPNYAYAPPNAALYTVNVSGSGGLRRAGQQVPGAADNGRGISVGALHVAVHSYGAANWAQPEHMLWHEGIYDGWVHARVYNQMIWDGVVSVCTYRAAR